MELYSPKHTITLENVHRFSIPLSEHPLKWIFENEEKVPSLEYEDQIIALTSEASKFLWDFESTQNYLGSISGINTYFDEQDEFKVREKQDNELKKWLYNRGIPFDQKVFWVKQPDCGFVLTWKMVIKFSDTIFFGNDEVVWDRTLNWCLVFDHNDIFYFGKNRRRK